MNGRKIYCYPEVMDKNEYLSLNVKIWENMGFDVQSFRDLGKKLLSPKTWRQDILVLNFFENAVTGRFPLLRLIRSSVFLCLARILVGKIVWVRHNYVPHQIGHGSTFLFHLMCNLLRLFSDQIVAHRPVEGLAVTQVVPHPLYRKSVVNGDCATNSSCANYSFLYFGQVRRYKGLTHLLEFWPKQQPLTMLGYCDDSDLENEIRAVITRRDLAVTWTNGFVASDELDTAIQHADFVIIPHVDKSMIVTGAAFHAMSLGANILVNQSDFSDWAAKVYPFSFQYNTELLTKNIMELQPLDKTTVIRFSNEINGDDAVAHAWARVFLSA